MSLFEVGNYVIIDDTYIGKNVKNIWNGYGMIVKLDNETNYIDDTILQYHLVSDITNNSDIKGFMLVKPNNKVRLVNKHNLANLIMDDLNKEKFMYIDNRINKNFNHFKINILPILKTNIMSSVPVIPLKTEHDQITEDDRKIISENLKLKKSESTDNVGIGSILSMGMGMGFNALGGGNHNNKTNQQLSKIDTFIKTNNLSEYIMIPANFNFEKNNMETNNTNKHSFVGGVYNPYISNVSHVPQLINTYTRKLESSKKESLDKLHKTFGGVSDTANTTMRTMRTMRTMQGSHITLPTHIKTQGVITSSEHSEALGFSDTLGHIEDEPETNIHGDNLTEFREQDKTEDNYELYIKNMISNLFKEEDKIDHEETFNDGRVYAGIAEELDLIADGEKDNKIKPTIKGVLEQFNSISKDLYLDLRNTLLYKHIISDNKLDTVSFGKELILRIKECLINIQSKIRYEDGRKTTENVNLFGYIKFKIAGGYIIMEDMTKEYLSLRTITRELVPDLKILETQYDNPIDYKILSSIILENKTTMSLQKNKEAIMESLNILAQEYIICLQPRVEYLLWTLTRLILCWYSDPVLNDNILKIKILINLYRARGIKEFNKEIGIQPVIKIIPKYGRESSLKILSNLSYYFFPYKNVGWKGSSPSYFNKVDDLIYYTNGSIDLKRYIKHLLKTGNKILNPISTDFTKVKLTNNDNEIEYRLPTSK
jgi:hypothetical protein